MHYWGLKDADPQMLKLYKLFTNTSVNIHELYDKLTAFLRLPYGLYEILPNNFKWSWHKNGSMISYSDDIQKTLKDKIKLISDSATLRINNHQYTIKYSNEKQGWYQIRNDDINKYRHVELI